MCNNGFSVKEESFLRLFCVNIVGIENHDRVCYNYIM